MAQFGNYSGYDQYSQSRISETQSYRPAEFLARFEHQKDTYQTHLNPNSYLPQPTLYKESFIGGLNSHNDEFYKSKVMELSPGGQSVYLQAVNNYKPFSGANDPQTMDQIRQQHIMIMDQKVKEAIITNGNNAFQQVKTVIVEPITQVVEMNVSNVQEGFHGISRRSGAGTIIGQGQLSGVSYAPLPNSRFQRRGSQTQGTSQVTIQGNHQQGSSRIQYVPFQRKVTELETRQWVERVPVTRTIVQYQDKKMVEQVPVQKTVIDYYAVQHVIQYQPRVVEQTIVEMVPIEKTEYITSYVPIQQQILHTTSETGKKQSRVLYQGPPTAQGERNKAQSRIKYLPQIPLAKTNSRISYENPMVAGNQIPPLERKLSRTNSNLQRQNSSNNLIPVQKPLSPINVRRQQQHVYHQNFIETGIQNYGYNQPIPQPLSYMPNPSPVLPFTNQLYQGQQVQHGQQFQQGQQLQGRTLKQSPFPQYNQHVTFAAGSNYPPPSQVQTVYQIPNNQTVNYAQPYPSNQMHQAERFTFSQPQQEYVVEEKKVIRRQNSGISLTK